MRVSATQPGWSERRPGPARSVRSVEIGDVLGGTYRLLSPIRRGGMGEVFLATHERLPMEFAVKVLNPLLFDERSFARFRQEAAMLARLRHPNIVQLVDFNWTEEGLPYLVMEHLPGNDLGELLSRQPRLAPEQIFSIVHQTACGLFAAHDAGIAHLDLNPSNLMVVGYEGRASVIKVIDFGIAHCPEGNERHSSAGTPEFMSPEQLDGRPEAVGFASDQFALGVISYLMLTGTLPWPGHGQDLLEAIASAEPQPMPLDEPHRAVEAVVRRALAKAPLRRFPSTLAYARALRRAMGRDGFLPEPVRRTPRPQPAPTEAVPAPAPAERLATTHRVNRRRTASVHGQRRHVRLVALLAVLLATLTWLGYPARGEAARAWRSVHEHATHAVHRWIAGGRSLIDAASEVRR